MNATLFLSNEFSMPLYQLDFAATWLPFLCQYFRYRYFLRRHLFNNITKTIRCFQTTVGTDDQSSRNFEALVGIRVVLMRLLQFCRTLYGKAPLTQGLFLINLLSTSLLKKLSVTSKNHCSRIRRHNRLFNFECHY